MRFHPSKLAQLAQCARIRSSTNSVKDLSIIKEVWLKVRCETTSITISSQLARQSSPLHMEPVLQEVKLLSPSLLQVFTQRIKVSSSRKLLHCLTIATNNRLKLEAMLILILKTLPQFHQWNALSNWFRLLGHLFQRFSLLNTRLLRDKRKASTKSSVLKIIPAQSRFRTV